MNVLFYVDIGKGIRKKKVKNARNEKWKKLDGFSYTWNMANYEVFLYTI